VRVVLRKALQAVESICRYSIAWPVVKEKAAVTRRVLLPPRAVWHPSSGLRVLPGELRASENWPLGNKIALFITMVSDAYDTRCVHSCAGRWARAWPCQGKTRIPSHGPSFWGREVLQQGFKISSVRADTIKQQLKLNVSIPGLESSFQIRQLLPQSSKHEEVTIFHELMWKHGPALRLVTSALLRSSLDFFKFFFF